MRIGHSLLLLVLVANFITISNAVVAAPSVDRALRGARETDELQQEERVSISGVTEKLKKVFATSNKKKLERAATLVAKKANNEEFVKAKISPKYMYKAMGLEAKMGKYSDWERMSSKTRTELFLSTRWGADQALLRKLNKWDDYDIDWKRNIYSKV